MKPIIIQAVERVTVNENGEPVAKRQVNAVFRFAVADPTLRIPLPSLSRSLHAQAPQEDILLLQSGAEIEKHATVLVATTLNQAQTLAALVARWEAENTKVQADIPGRFYGMFYDGATWNAAPPGK